MKTELTDNEIRVRIAEACGWKTGTRICCGGSYDVWTCSTYSKFNAPPDYLTSLDAMAEAEKHAPKSYWLTLLKVVGAESFVAEWQRLKAVASATARQRALAFLATIAP